MGLSQRDPDLSWTPSVPSSSEHYCIEGCRKLTIRLRVCERFSLCSQALSAVRAKISWFVGLEVQWMGRIFPKLTLTESGRVWNEADRTAGSVATALISCQGSTHCLITLLIVSYFHEGALAGDSVSPDSQAAHAGEPAPPPQLLLPGAWLKTTRARRPSVCLFNWSAGPGTVRRFPFTGSANWVSVPAHLERP